MIAAVDEEGSDFHPGPHFDHPVDRDIIVDRWVRGIPVQEDKDEVLPERHADVMAWREHVASDEEGRAAAIRRHLSGSVEIAWDIGDFHIAIGDVHTTEILINGTNGDPIILVDSRTGDRAHGQDNVPTMEYPVVLEVVEECDGGNIRF